MRVCTAISRNALAYVRVLSESLAEQNSAAEFTALVVDDPEGTIGAAEEFATLTPREIGLDEREFYRAAAMYSVHGLVVSMKSRLLRRMLAREASPVLLLDADVFVYAGLEPLAELAQQHEIVLSPHSLEPIPTRAGISADKAFLRTGVFNSGFVGVGPGAEPFLDWWSTHCARDCVLDLGRGLHNDQAWLALVPALFRHHVLRDPGCNVMGHNLIDRDVEFRPDGRAEIEGVPLRFFHFTMFDPATRDWRKDPRWYWFPSLQDRPGAARLCREYADRLEARGYGTTARLTSAYEVLPDGQPFDAPMRRAYRDALVEAERTGRAEPPNPFVDGTAAFVSWLNEPSPDDQPSGPTRLEVATRAEEAGAAQNDLLGKRVEWLQAQLHERLEVIEGLKAAYDELRRTPWRPVARRMRRLLQPRRRTHDNGTTTAS